MAFDLQRLKQLVDRYGRVARIVITAVRGSTPRTVGTEMFVWDNGQDGTIGGGALEYQVTNAAEQALKEQRTWAHTYPLGPIWDSAVGVPWGFYAKFLITRHYRQHRQMW